jgi:membrane protease YdiL (CAAX protease family)
MNSNKWILLVLFLILMTILAIGYFDIPSSALISYDILASLPISKFLIYILACLIMPTIEEYAFRYWTLAKGYKKYISLSLFVAFVILSLKSRVLIASFVLVIGYIIVAKAPIAFKIIASSIFFSLLHLDVNTLNLSFFFYFFVYFLLAVLFCLLYYKKGIWLSIIVHISYNTFLLLFLGNNFNGFNDKTEVFTLNQTTVTLQHHNIFYSHSFSSHTKSADSIIIKGMNKSTVLRTLLNKNESYIYEIEPSLDRISVSITGTSAVDRQRVLEKAFKLKYDTLEAKATDVYELLYRPNTAQIEASKQTRANKDYTLGSPVNAIGESLSEQYSMLIKSKEPEDTNYLYLNFPVENSFEQNKQILENQYGLKFIKTKKEVRKIYVSFGR